MEDRGRLVPGSRRLCTYLDPPGGVSPYRTAADDYAAMRQRTKDTYRVLALIPQPRRATLFDSVGDPWHQTPPSVECSGIDPCIERTAATAGVALGSLTTDLEFLRRVTLDLTGRIPSADDAIAFQGDPLADKRAQLVSRLLETDAWADRWTMLFGDLYRNTAKTSLVQRYADGRDAFHMFLLESMQQNKPYDQMAREILAAEGTSDGRTYPKRYEDYEHYASTYQDFDGNPATASAVSYIDRWPHDWQPSPRHVRRAGNHHRPGLPRHFGDGVHPVSRRSGPSRGVQSLGNRGQALRRLELGCVLLRRPAASELEGGAEYFAEEKRQSHESARQTSVLVCLGHSIGRNENHQDRWLQEKEFEFENNRRLQIRLEASNALNLQQLGNLNAAARQFDGVQGRIRLKFRAGEEDASILARQVLVVYLEVGFTATMAGHWTWPRSMAWEGRLRTRGVRWRAW